MAKIGRTLQDLAAEITRRAEVKKDLIAPVAKLSMADDGQLQVQNGQVQAFKMNDVATPQLAEYAGIPLPYYRKMQAEAPQLLAANVNRWLADKGTDRRMVRTLDGVARAVLSDKYRALENEDLAEAVLPIVLDKGMLIVSSEITERRLYIKAVDKSIELDVPTGKKMGDSSHTFFDTVSPAIVISNSEVGHGALSIETGVYTRVCTNLAMIGQNMRKYHTGARAELSDEVYALLTDKTRRLTDAAVWSQVKDVVANALDRVKFDAFVQKLKGATEAPIQADVTEVIERVGRRFAFNEGERSGILKRLIEGADLTQYGLHAAITRASQDVEQYDRATEMERIGGQVIELGAKDWRELAIAE